MSSFLPNQADRVPEIKPWNNSNIIESNLAIFAGLQRNQKLKKYDHRGLFSVSKAGLFQFQGLKRSAEDSINFLKEDIIMVFREAKRRNIKYDAALRGMNVLQQTYQGTNKRKNNVKEIILAVENLDKNFAGYAYNALHHARSQIKWSVNKAYQVSTNMTKKASSLNINQDMHNISGPDRIDFVRKRFNQALTQSNNQFIQINKNRIIDINRKLSHKIDLSQEEVDILNEYKMRQKHGDRPFALDDLASFGVGNCSEMSSLAFNYLKSQNVAVARISLGTGGSFEGDHVFLLVGHNFYGFDADGKYIQQGHEPWLDYKEIKDNNNAYVCDPWANIVCPAMAYPAEWELKMQKWSKVQKFIKYNHVAIDPYKDPNYRKCISLCRWHLRMQHIPS